MTRPRSKPPSTLRAGSVVVVYVRDSGGINQTESIDQQVRAIEKYCDDKKLVIAQIYRETMSGRNSENRKQFLKLYDDVITALDDIRPDGLILWEYSRFSRNIVDFNYFLYGLIRHGLFIVSVSEPLPDGVAGQVMLSLKAYQAQEVSENMGRQIKRAIADRVRQGFCNGGQPPRGYIIVKDRSGTRRNGQERSGIKWEVDRDLAPIIRLAWELRAAGKGYGYITKATSGKLYTNAGSWKTHFSNKSYLGLGKAGGLEVPDHHEPIITPELWDAVQKLSQTMPGAGRSGDMTHPRRMSNPSLLAGLAFCKFCNSAMILHTAADYRSYRCGKRDRQKGWNDCPQARSVNARKAERYILDAVLNDILSPAYLETLLDEIQSQIVDVKKMDDEIEIETNKLNLTEKSITRLVKLAETDDDIQEIHRRLGELRRDRGESTAKIMDLKKSRAVEVPTITPGALEKIFASWRAKIESAQQSGDILTAKRLLASFVSKIELSHDAAIIHYTYPVVIPVERDSLFSAHKTS